MPIRACAGAALIMLFSAAALEAQAWTVTIKPTKNPIAIGQCSQVNIRVIDPVTKGTPHTAGGHYVSNVGDFDMAVQSAGKPAVVGKYESSTAWVACACQSATVGQQGVITATYPRKSLSEKLRIPGVALIAQVPFTISAAEGKYDPPGCEVIKTATRPPMPPPSGSSTGGTSTGGTTTGGTATAPAPVPGPTVASGRTPLTSSPLSPAQPPTAATTQTLIKRSGESTKGKGPPFDVTVEGTPTGVRVTFAYGDSGGTIKDRLLYRKDGAQLSTLRNSLETLVCAYGDSYGKCVGGFFEDVPPDNTVSYVFTVVNVYSDGTRAESAPALWTFPPLVNPSGFSASDQGEGTVNLDWLPVEGALSYRLDGPGVPNTGLVTKKTTTTVSSVPRGSNTWQLKAVYAGNFADYANPSLATEIVRYLPPHPVPWLSKKSGPGNDSIATAHFGDPCSRQSADGSILNWVCPPELLSKLKSVPDALNFWDQPKFQAIYGNPTDLGFGRRTSCAEGMAPPPGFMTTICWTTSHGPGAGEKGFADPKVITDAATTGDLFRTTTMIIKDATGMRFLVFGPPTGGSGYDDIPSAPSHFILLDTQGQKFAPHTCMSCHGGTYDSVSNRVKGATLQPLNPSELVYAGGPAGRAAQEESIRKINNYVLRASPSAAVAAYINGLYGGNASVAGTRAIDDYVPSGWSSQAGLYRQVVRPYCSTCHLAADQAYSFSSWGNFQGNAALINVAVCVVHTMPHAELPFKEFWTKKTGILYLPGLLATSLGFPSC